MSLLWNLVPFIRVIAAWLLVLIILPGSLIRGSDIMPRPERLYRNASFAVAVSVLIAYLLEFLKVYELLSLAVALSALLVLLHLKDVQRACINSAAFLLDAVDKPSIVWQRIRDLLPKHTGFRFPSEWIPFAAVWGAAAWLRFSDAITHWAPGMADSYVVMAWVKYLENQSIFHDGIYPHGFHFILSVIRKLSAVPAVYSVKYVGPLNGLLIIGSVYTLTWMLTQKKAGALLAAGIYGVFYGSLHYDAYRQAITNSQEFGLAFVLISIGFSYRFLCRGGREYLLAYTSALLVTGLVHPVPALFAAFGVAAVGAACLLTGSTNVKRLLTLVSWSLGAAAIAVLPLLAGYLLGHGLHSSSVEFIQSFDREGLTLWPIYKATLAAALVGLLLCFIKYKNCRSESAIVLSLSIVGVVVYLTSLAGPRSIEFPALVAPVAIGWFVSLPLGGRMNSRVGTWAALAVLVLIRIWMPPAPLSIIYFEPEGSVKAMIKIYRELMPGQWTIVNNREGYSWSLGVGGHIHSSGFAAMFPPRWPLKARSQPQYDDDPSLYEGQSFIPKDYVISSSDILIFTEKVQFQLPIGSDGYTVQELTERRARVQSLLKDWVRHYMLWSSDHPRAPKLEVFYQDNEVAVYRLRQEVSKIAHYSGDAGV